MPRLAQSLGCLLLGAVVLTGCSAGEDLLTEEQLPDLVLQPGDLDDGYERFDEGRLAIADRPTGARSEPGRFGRLDGWKARYRLPEGGETAVAAVVESRVDLFADSDGAEQELAAHRAELTGEDAGAVEEVPDLGDDAFVQVRSQGAGASLAFVTVAWRQANATGSVVVNGTGAGEDVEAAALRLARAQQERMSSAGPE